MLSFSSSLLRPPWFWSYWSEEFDSCTSCWGELVLSADAAGADAAGADADADAVVVAVAGADAVAGAFAVAGAGACACACAASAGRETCEPEERGKLCTECGGDCGWTII